MTLLIAIAVAASAMSRSKNPVRNCAASACRIVSTAERTKSGRVMRACAKRVTMHARDAQGRRASVISWVKDCHPAKALGLNFHGRIIDVCLFT